jgi:general secretion pathway protein K
MLEVRRQTLRRIFHRSKAVWTEPSRRLRPWPSFDQRGFALLIVLWAMVLLSLLLTQLTSAGRNEAQLAANLRRAADVQAAADGAIHDAAFHLLTAGPSHWAYSGSYRLTIGQCPVAIEVRNLAGEVNPNSASLALLQALLQGVGVDRGAAGGIAAAIIDWRSPGTAARASGAKAPQYRAAGYNYGPPNAPFQSLDEVGNVLGMTPQIMQRLAPHLSIYAQDTPDPNLADAVVAKAMRESGEDYSDAASPDNGLALSITATAARAGAIFTRYAVIASGDLSESKLFFILDWRPN